MTAPPDSAGRLLDVLVAPFRAYGVYAAVQLGLPDRLATGAVEARALADELAVDPDALRRLLRMLASLQLVAPVEPDAYRLDELGELLRTDVPNSMQALATCYAEQFYLPFRHIASCIRDGRQGFADVFGAPLFEHYANNPHDGHIFDAAMAAGSSFFRAVPQVHDFSDATRVVDVGGGDGSLLADILATNQHLHGVLAEMPRLADTARVRLQARGLIERCMIVGCDLFQDVPDGADVYILSRILHDWDDNSCQQILRVTRAAMRPDARLLVIERVVPSEAHTPSFAFDFDLHMLVNTGGRERDPAEYDALFAASGLRWTHTAGLPLGFHIITAIPDDADHNPDGDHHVVADGSRRSSSA